MSWVTIDKTWHDTTVDYCDVCGNLLIRRAWEFTGRDGQTLRACREDDQRLHAQLRQYESEVEAARVSWAGRQARGQ